MGFKKQLIGLVACLTLGMGFAAMAQPDTTNEPEVIISDSLMRALERVSLATLDYGEAIRTGIDRSAFEQKALIKDLKFDASEITNFVAEQIAFEPYAGVLRGAQGTLLARAGNALDQSLLLATLLKDAGIDAVIRSGPLTNAEAARLVSTLHRRPPAPAPWDTAAVAKAQTGFQNNVTDLNKAYAESGREAKFSMEDVIAGINLDRDEILAALGSAGVKLGSDDKDAAIIREAEKYYWVSYREGPSLPWVAVHPAFGKEDSPDVEFGNTFADTVPTKLSHRVRIELIVEQRFGGKMNSNAMMEPMEIPSANLAAGSLSIGLVPDALIRKDPYANGASPLADTRFLIPIINNGIPKGGQVLALDGTLVPPEAISVSQAGIFQEVGEQFLSAASALQGLDLTEDEQQVLVALESVRLQVTLIHPADGERKIERFLYHAPGESNLDENADPDTRRKALVAELARSHSLGFASGTIAPEFVADATLADLALLAPTIRALTDPAIDECKTPDCFPKSDIDPNEMSAGPAMFLASFDQQMPVEPGSVVYRDAPNIVRVSQPYFPENSPVPGVFDIMNNSRRAFREKDGWPVYAPELVLMAGVAETHLERLQPGEPGGTAADLTIERVIGTTHSMQLKVLNSDASMSLLAGKAKGAEQVLIENALSKGSFVLLATKEHVDSDALLGWWEVDPVSGRTLGMARYGGLEVLDYVSIITLIALATTPAITYGMGYCNENLPERVIPGTNRVEKANFLSCVYCAATTVFSHLGVRDSSQRRERVRDDVNWCVDWAPVPTRVVNPLSAQGR